jgi:hypothetical protein
MLPKFVIAFVSFVAAAALMATGASAGRAGPPSCSTKSCAGGMAAAVRFWPTRERLLAVCDQTSLVRKTRRKDWISGANGAVLHSL